jgi:hypothetical protein
MMARYYVNLDTTLQVDLDLAENTPPGEEYDQVRAAFIHELRRLLLDPNVATSDFNVTIEDEA